MHNQFLETSFLWCWKWGLQPFGAATWTQASVSMPQGLLPEATPLLLPVQGYQCEVYAEGWGWPPAVQAEGVLLTGCQRAPSPLPDPQQYQRRATYTNMIDFPWPDAARVNQDPRVAKPEFPKGSGSTGLGEDTAGWRSHTGTRPQPACASSGGCTRVHAATSEAGQCWRSSAPAPSPTWHQPATEKQGIAERSLSRALPCLLKTIRGTHNPTHHFPTTDPEVPSYSGVVTII